LLDKDHPPRPGHRGSRADVADGLPRRRPPLQIEMPRAGEGGEAGRHGASNPEPWRLYQARVTLTAQGMRRVSASAAAEGPWKARDRRTPRHGPRHGQSCLCALGTPHGPRDAGRSANHAPQKRLCPRFAGHAAQARAPALSGPTSPTCTRSSRTTKCNRHGRTWGPGSAHSGRTCTPGSWRRSTRRS